VKHRLQIDQLLNAGFFRRTHAVLRGTSGTSNKKVMICDILVVKCVTNSRIWRLFY